MKKYLTIAGVLASCEIALVLYLTFWRKVFWNYVEVKDYNHFLIYLLIFIIVALVLCAITALETYMSTLSAIKWREKLNKCGLALKHSDVENANQRIQEDCSNYPTLVVTIGFGVVKAIVYLIVFSIALIHQFNAIYLIVIFLYGIIATFIARIIAHPLIDLNYRAQQMEATYRNDLNEYNFKNCILVLLGLAKKLKHLNYFQSFYGQLSVIIPICIVAHDYFTTEMLLGGLMQATSMMAVISEDLSFGINSFDSINKLLSCRKRLLELGVLK